MTAVQNSMERVSGIDNRSVFAMAGLIQKYLILELGKAITRKAIGCLTLARFIPMLDLFDNQCDLISYIGSHKI